MGTPLDPIVQQEIAEKGPISVARYMELCLGHPQHGYYMRSNPLGAAGDFITSPEVSQIFGELIGAWLANQWGQMGSPYSALVELGPGRGTLMKDALRATSHVRGFQEAIDVFLVEMSPVLANIQYHALKDTHPRIRWLDRVDELPPLPLLLIANEFFDALPIHQYVKTPAGLAERKIDWDEAEQQYRFVAAPAGLSLAKGNDGMNEGAILESCPAAKAVMGAIADHLASYGGAALIIDYGYVGEPHADTLQAVKAHHFTPVLSTPGEADLTAHVDFSTLAEIAQGKGIATHGPINQGTLLSRLGAEVRAERLARNAAEDQRQTLYAGLERLISPGQMGGLFKCMALVSDPNLTPPGFDITALEASFF